MRLRWLVPAAIFLLVAIGTLTPHSYFLHFDTSNIDVAAADLAKDGCWGDPAATLAPVLFTTIPYLMFGSHALWQTILLTLCGVVMVAALFRITERVTGSERWALIVSLWAISLPTMLYYTRMHLGFPLMLLVLGMMLYVERRWWWCGVSFALSVFSHFNFSIPSAAFLIFAVLLTPAESRIRAALIIVAGIMLTVLVIEGIEFLFVGIPFHWVRAVIGDAGRLSAGITTRDGWPLTHLIRMIAISNGWLNALLLIAGIAYPLVRRPRVPIMDTIYLTGWSVFAFYTLRIVTGNVFLTPRMFSAIYPLFMIVSAFTACRLLQRIKRPYQRAAVAAASLLIAFGTVGSAAETAFASKTGFGNIDHAYQQAAQAGLPVRYFGNFHVAYFFARQYAVETSINEISPEIVGGDTQAVLIFENNPQDDGAARFVESGDLDPANYEISLYPHTVMSSAFSIEEYGMSPDYLDELDVLIRQPSRPRGSVEIWWPNSPDGEFQTRIDGANYVYYYRGSGCVVSRRFGEDHSKNYYDVLAEKGVILWKTITTSGFGEAFRLVKQWLAQ